jgi:bile acid-coenzyme A ligase
MDQNPISFAARIAELASTTDHPALVFEELTLSYGELDRWANRFARRLLEEGVGVGDFVTIAAPNGPEFIVAVVSCWKIGAIPQPVSARLPVRELEAIVGLADSAAVVGATVEGRRTASPAEVEGYESSPLPDVVSPAWKAPTSGGSTGRPKLIVSGDPSRYSENIENLAVMIGVAGGETLVMPGPMYHNGPFIWAFSTLLAGGTVVLLPRFDAEATLAAVAAHRAEALYLVPTMMQRIWKLPDDVKFSYDLTSLQRAFHLAEPCPPWLKEVWIEWVGADVLWELYGGTEGQSATVLSGVEWLQRRGSVGRPSSGEIRILDEDGQPVEPGVVGEVWMRATGRESPTYRYIGAEAETRDGWDCLGDLGWMDTDGYLYLADRRSDMVLVGGANIYPAEVEAAISEHPLVRSCAVIGLPDEERGNRVHAIVDFGAELGAVDEDGLRVFLGERLVSYKVPRTFEFVAEPLRDDAGKVRRSALRAERLSAASDPT